MLALAVVSINRTGNQLGINNWLQLGDFQTSTSLVVGVVLSLLIIWLLVYQLLTDRRNLAGISARLRISQSTAGESCSSVLRAGLLPTLICPEIARELPCSVRLTPGCRTLGNAD
jgi:hypothetical protein